jgi:hypothetical protein
MLVVGQPELGHETREAREQRSIQQTLPAKECVAPTFDEPQSKFDDENTWIGGRNLVDNSLAEDARRSPVCE